MGDAAAQNHGLLKYSVADRSGKSWSGKSWSLGRPWGWGNVTGMECEVEWSAGWGAARRRNLAIGSRNRNRGPGRPKNGLSFRYWPCSRLGVLGPKCLITSRSLKIFKGLIL